MKVRGVLGDAGSGSGAAAVVEGNWGGAEATDGRRAGERGGGDVEG